MTELQSARSPAHTEPAKPASADIERMTPHECQIWLRTEEYAGRSAALQGRIDAGEPMTLDYVAAQLGLPFWFFAESWASLMTLLTGVPHVPDLGAWPTTH